MKRGDISIGVVVALVIALIVVLLLIGLLVTRFNLFGQGTSGLQTEAEKRVCGKVGQCQSGTSCISGTNPVTPVPSQGWIDCTGICCKLS